MPDTVIVPSKGRSNMLAIEAVHAWIVIGYERCC